MTCYLPSGRQIAFRKALGRIMCCGGLIVGKLLEGSSPFGICRSELCVMCDVKCALVWVFHPFGLLVYESIDEMKYLNKKLIRTCPLGEYCYYVEAI